MEKIKSFTIDHIKLQPGVYVSRKDYVGDQVITTFDLRMTSPNEEPVMNTAEMHAMEHLGATFLRNDEEYKDKIIYFGPMGCRTGFYLLLLQNIEKKISKIEEEVLQGQCPDFNMRMLHLKKKISKLYRYYSQLTEVGQELLDNEMDFFSKDDLRMFDRYRDRASRLAAETQILRDYAMQVQDVYQSEIGIRQNEVMRVLTVVTTIFLPLTLIAGWYGMNFAGMPELGWKYGYPVVIAVSIAIVVICLIIFKKKKFW